MTVSALDSLVRQECRIEAAARLHKTRETRT
jgi:hypothetical protein